MWEHKNLQILQFWYVRKGFKGYLTVSCHHKYHGCHPGVMFQQVVFELCTFLVNMFKTGEDKSLLPCKIKSSLKSTATVKCRNKSVYSKGHNTDEIILVQTGLQILRLLWVMLLQLPISPTDLINSMNIWEKNFLCLHLYKQNYVKLVFCFFSLMAVAMVCQKGWIFFSSQIDYIVTAAWLSMGSVCMSDDGSLFFSTVSKVLPLLQLSLSWVFFCNV